MAQFGAQLSALAALQHDLPSIFEVIAQESLMSTLKPAMKHVFRVMAQNNPERFGSVYRYSDELYSSLQLVLEYYYLKNYSASFSENFYGLKRASLKSRNRTEGAASIEKPDSGAKQNLNGGTTRAFQHLSKSEQLRSLFFLVVLPYIKNKCDQLYEKLSSSPQNDNVQSAQQDALKRRLCKVFLSVYPMLHFLWQGTQVAYRLAYAFGKSFHHSPFLRLAGVLLLGLTPSDLAALSARSGHTVSLMQLLKDRRWGRFLLMLAGRMFSTVSMVLSSGLSFGIFFLQFLDWWYARDHDTTSLMALPKPDCPKQLEVPSLPKVVTVCPLCNRIRTNDTVLAVTGYVFCYPCIFRYVQEKGCCPVTGYPATTDHLVKLFLTDV